jgi:hypothetical protein
MTHKWANSVIMCGEKEKTDLYFVRERAISKERQVIAHHAGQQQFKQGDRG